MRQRVLLLVSLGRALRDVQFFFEFSRVLYAIAKIAFITSRRATASLDSISVVAIYDSFYVLFLLSIYSWLSWSEHHTGIARSRVPTPLKA